MSIVQLDNISKKYRTHANKISTFKEKFVNIFQSRYFDNVGERWVLQDVNLSLEKGEFFGVIGPNGSGKTTLLYIVAKTLRPTSGTVSLQGRIAPMIEIGLGFNPELTGRENIYLNASLFGMNRAEIEAKYQQIIEFSELGDYIYSPLRYYSTGMIARLAFAVNIHIDADIYLIDEFMAVGDAHYTQKCLAHMEKLKKKNKTVIFVSHSMDLVRQVCDRACLLIEGKIIQSGEVDPVIDCYKSFVN